MSPLTDAILWIAISTGILLCVTWITAYRIARGRQYHVVESYHAETERAYRAARTAAAHGGPAR